MFVPNIFSEPTSRWLAVAAFLSSCWLGIVALGSCRLAIATLSSCWFAVATLSSCWLAITALGSCWLDLAALSSCWLAIIAALSSCWLAIIAALSSYWLAIAVLSCCWLAGGKFYTTRIADIPSVAVDPVSGKLCSAVTLQPTASSRNRSIQDFQLSEKVYN